jgi:drug/metabolite transporter (DMT)-like permease
LLFGLAFGGLDLAVPLRTFGWLLLAVVVQIAGWLLITASLPRLPAALSSMLLLLQPVLAMVLAAIILHRRPTPVQLIGAAVACGGVVAAAITQGQREPRAIIDRGRINAAGGEREADCGSGALAE